MIFNIIDFLGSRGYRYTKESFLHIYDYLRSMVNDGRILMIYEDRIPVTFCAFSICDDIKPYYDKNVWSYLPHNINGKIIFIEKLVSVKWNKELRIGLEDEIIRRYPHLELATWYRPSSDYDIKKSYVIKRRTPYVPN